MVGRRSAHSVVKHCALSGERSCKVHRRHDYTIDLHSRLIVELNDIMGNEVWTHNSIREAARALALLPKLILTV